MADTMKVFCPHCLNEFDVDVDAGEEVLNPTATITKHSSMRASWSDIAAEIRSGHGYRVLSLGDTVTFQLTNGNMAIVEVVAVNPYDENSMAFCFVDCIDDSAMNDTATNSGGWAKCKMRKTLNEEIIKLLPADLAEVIKPRTITQIFNGRKYEATDKLWLPSRTELFGFNENYKDIDFGDVQFPGFDNEKKRVKLLNGETALWWERSPFYYHSHRFCSVHYSGNANLSYAYCSYGVAPAFII